MDNCEITHFHPQAIDSAEKSMPSEKTIVGLSEMFKLLSDPTRLKIVLALLSCELCVCDISTVVGISHSAASHQLRVLRTARLARFRKDGKLIYYTIDDEHVASVIKMAVEHINHN